MKDTLLKALAGVLVIALTIWVAQCVWGAEPIPIVIIGPDKVDPGRDYLLKVNGLTAEMLPRVTLEAQPKTTMAVGVHGWTGEQFIWFRASEKGTSVVTVGLNGLVDAAGNGRPSLSTLILEVGTPPPPPPPPIPPIPPGDRQIVVIEESDSQDPDGRTWQDDIVMLGLKKWANSSKIRIRIVDQHLQDHDTARPAKWLAPLLADQKVKGKPLPLLVIVAGSSAGGKSGDVVVVEAVALPETVEAAVKEVERYITPPSVINDNSSLYVPTPIDVGKRMLAEAKPLRSEVLYDLGCGDGRLLCLAAKQYGCKCEGWETNPQLAAACRLNVRACGVEDLVTIHEGDLHEADLSKADVVLVYLDTATLEKLGPSFCDLPIGARIVSHAHSLPTVAADRTVPLRSVVTGREHKLYITQWPPSKSRLPGAKHGWGTAHRSWCDMCQGNHMIETHKVARQHLDQIGYRTWQAYHSNLHNLAQAN